MNPGDSERDESAALRRRGIPAQSSSVTMPAMDAIKTFLAIRLTALFFASQGFGAFLQATVNLGLVRAGKSAMVTSFEYSEKFWNALLKIGLASPMLVVAIILLIHEERLVRAAMGHRRKNR